MDGIYKDVFCGNRCEKYKKALDELSNNDIFYCSEHGTWWRLDDRWGAAVRVAYELEYMELPEKFRKRFEDPEEPTVFTGIEAEVTEHPNGDITRNQ